MKRVVLLLVWLCCVGCVVAQGRREVDFNFDWRFRSGDSSIYAASHFDDRAWRMVHLPHDFQIEQPWVAPSEDERVERTDRAANVRSRLSGRGFKEMGVGWYRKRFVADPQWQDRRVLIDFGGIMYVGDVYLNGERVGGTDYGYLGFEIDLTSHLRYGAENVLAVRADTRDAENSRWYTGGGLFRAVKLIVTDLHRYFTRHPLYITTPLVQPDEAAIVVQAEIACAHKGTLDTRLQITDPEGRVVADRRVAFDRRRSPFEYRFDTIRIANPALWECENPRLYTATVTIYDEHKQIADQTSELFGVRKIEYSPHYGMRLNGRKVLLKGVANHHSLGALGAAAYPRAIEKRIQLLKSYGVNHIRTSHNPYSEEFMELCDRYGILVVNELYDKWLDRFCGGRVPWATLWQRDIPEWVKRDRNHPSVVMWSLGNELQTYWKVPHYDWGVTPYRMQRTLLHRYDTTRPITVAMHPRGRHPETDSLPAPLVHETDIASYNYRYMYFPLDGRNFPDMIFYQSEANTSNMGPNFFGMDLDKVVGLAYWGQIDYLGESGGWPAKGWAQGSFDCSLQPKPIAYLLKSMYSDEPVVHIGVVDSEVELEWNDVQIGTPRMSDHWNRKTGERLTIYTYTNCEEVELRLNGRRIGTKRNPQGAERNKICWTDIPYRAGCLEAVGRNQGREVVRHRIETVGKAMRLVAEPDNACWRADGMDLQHVRLSAVDHRGRRVPFADDLLHFSVEGDASIVAVDNGNICSEELHTLPQRRLYHGSALVILRAGRSADTIRLKIESERFEAIEVMMPTR